MMHHRQGDVLTLKTSMSLEDLKDKGKAVKDARGVVLAEGEATGHYHAIKEQGVEMFEVGDKRFVHVPETFATTPAELTHQEHDTIRMEPGIWEVRIQREYRGGQVKRVID